MLAQFVEQMGTEHDVPVFAALAAANVDDHSLGVDIGNLQTRQFGPPHADGIKRHQDGAMEWSRRGFDQAGDLILAQNHRKTKSLLLRVRCLIHAPRPFQKLDKEEPQSSDCLIHRVVAQFLVAEQVSDVLTDVIRTELVGRTVEVARKVLNDTQVGALVDSVKLRRWISSSINLRSWVTGTSL
jgi:hypothetical protein